MKKLYVILFVLLLTHCAGTKDKSIDSLVKNKNIFLCTTKKEGYDYLKMMNLSFSKIDSVNRNSYGKIYIFHYKK